MFDRYAGDNKTSTALAPLERFYTDANGRAVFPVLNLFSLLAAQHTDSVAARFYGKQRRDVALGVMAFCEITDAQGAETGELPILDEQGAPYHADDPRVRVLAHVARVKKAGLVVPSPKERPTLPKGWNISFTATVFKNQFLTPDTLRKMLEQAGVLGIGTFRPIFGRFVTEIHD